MAGQLKVGGNIIASHSGVEGAGTVTLQNVTLGDSAVPSRSMNFRNRIINGNFDIWQRGDNFSSSSVNEWSADRFRTEGYSLSSTISRQTFIANQTDVPQYPRYYCRVATSSAVSAGQYWAFQQRIEAPQNISYGTYTLSFWIRCTTGSLDAGAFKYGIVSSGELLSSPELSTTWTKLTQTHTISSFSASDYVSIYLIYLTNSSPSSLSVDIAQVQVEEGTVPTPFEHRPYGTELALCQRYYFKTFNQSVVPAQAADPSGSLTGSSSVNDISFISTMKLPVSMRIAPNPVKTYSTTHSDINWSDQAGKQPTSSVLAAGENAISVRATGSIAAGGAHSIHITAEAEL